MITFLLWNLKKKPLQKSVANIVLRHAVDIIVLTECTIPPGLLLRELNKNRSSYHYAPGIACTKVEIFVRFSARYINPVYESSRMTIRHIELPGIINILLAGVHFVSKMYWNDVSQAMECANLSLAIRDTEIKVGHNRTILMGDFNMNPFEDGMVSARGFNGVMSRRIAAKKKRVVQEKEYLYFYNPMWNLFGDEHGAPGTFYYPSSEHKAFFWNIFDQVLIRPDLLPYYSSKDIKILESDGSISFLTTEQLPDADNASDHLPVLFRLGI